MDVTADGSGENDDEQQPGVVIHLERRAEPEGHRVGPALLAPCLRRNRRPEFNQKISKEENQYHQITAQKSLRHFGAVG
jgi:hypothetical protein